MGKPNTPGCNSGGACCGDACTIAADSGAGADSTTISGTYEAAGNWARTSNRLHPDHAGSNQRLLWTAEQSGIPALPTDPYGQHVQADLTGQAADQMGVGIFYADQVGDDATDAYTQADWIHARVQFGTGTAGRLYVDTYDAGVLVDAWSADLECAANQYDVPTDADVTLALCTTKSRAAANYYIIVATLTIDATTHRVGFISGNSGGGIGAWLGTNTKAFAALTTGAAAVTANAANFAFSHRSDACEDCPVCDYWYDWDTAPPASFYTLSGDATYSGGLLNLTTVGDQALVNHDWFNDNLEIYYTEPTQTITGTRPWRVRFLFSYVDSDNYWCVEHEARDDGSLFAEQNDRARVIERVGGAETTHYEGIGTFSATGVHVHDCQIWVVFGAVLVCLDDTHDLNRTGTIGFRAMALTDEWEKSGVLWATCAFANDCDNPTLTDPRPEPDPGDPTGCCDLTELMMGDEFECTIANITYFGGGDCFTECTEIDSTWLAAFNNTHTLKVVWKSAAYIAIAGTTGMDNPCDGYAKDSPVGQMWITIYLKPVSETECQAFGAIHIPGGGGCGIAWFASNIFAKGDDCDTRELTWQSGNLNGCCLNATSGATLTLVKV